MSDSPSIISNSTVVDVANKLLPVLAEMDQAQNRHVELQRKAQKLMERVTAVSRTQTRNWTEARQAELVRLDSALNSMQLKLAAAQRNTQRLRRRFESRLSQFRTTFVHHDTRMTDLQAGNSRVFRHNAALDRSLRYLIREMDQKIQSEFSVTGYEVPAESHEYIPVGITDFLDMLCRLDGLLSLDPEYSHPEQRYRSVSFLEIGSGSGRNMMLVKASELILCDRQHGFDINPDQIAQGKALFGLGEALEVADALDYDYDGFDVVFFYRPFSDLDLQRQLVFSV